MDAANPDKAHARPRLSPLPKPPDITLPPPDKEHLDKLDEHLGRIASADELERERAVREILEVEADLIPAIHHRVMTVVERADREAMKRALLDVRDRAREEVRKRMRAAGEKGRVVTPDYLEMLSSYPAPDSTSWQNNIRVIAMSRMLAQIGTVEAVRELIRIYVRFGEFLRVDTQLQLEKLGDRALPGLIEARRHPAEKISRWAERQLDLLGKAIPSEVVQTDDHQVLADVLRAYGRTREPEAARLVISFSNSERAKIREAARQAVVMLGEVADWQLRDTYENIVGKRPPREWTWDRTARELFGEFDQLRLSAVFRLFEEGMATYEKGNLSAAIEAFDKVLARNPMFEDREQMVPAYLAEARAHADDARPAALAALRRAERLSSDADTKRPVTSLLLTLEGEELLERGLFDRVLFERALELDPSNARARRALEEVEQENLRQRGDVGRYLAATAIGLLALTAMAVIALRRTRSNSDLGAAAAPSAPGNASGEPAAERPAVPD